MREERIAIALAVQDEVRGHAARTAAAREQRLRQLECQADLAARRYYAFDPFNRAVAALLECAWNDCLHSADQARREHRLLAEADRSLHTVEARQRIESLAQDFSRLWHAPQTQPADRKRMLADIVEDVTLLRSPHCCLVQLRFHGGAQREVEVPLPCGASRLHEVQPGLVALFARLSAPMNGAEAAEAINRRGYRACLQHQGRVPAPGRLLEGEGARAARPAQ